jgi:hypothetical protein
MNRLLATLALAFLLIVSPSILQAQSVVVPNALAGAEGDIDNGFPFNISNFGLPSQRYQQVYAANQFSTIVGPQTITAIRFRPDSSFGSAFSSTINSIQINLSTTSAAVDALSSTFASNVGGNDTVVFSGALSLSSANIGGPPRNFDIVITLTTPFVYNPANGNLLLDVRNFSAGLTTQMDADSTFGDGTSRAYTFNGNVNSTTADTTDSVGLVTQFVFAAVPEPSTMILSGISALGVAYVLRRRMLKAKAEIA